MAFGSNSTSHLKSGWWKAFQAMGPSPTDLVAFAMVRPYISPALLLVFLMNRALNEEPEVTSG